MEIAGMSKDKFLRALLGRMTPEEKAGQLNLLTGAMDETGMKHSENLAEKIRSGLCGAVINVYTSEATRALQELALQSPQRIPLLFGYDVIHGHRTIFPIPLGLSCSWNLDLLERCARHAAAEAASDGLHWVFSPMVDISHDARWGRVAEGSGEDPWLGSQLAAAMVRGYQGKNLSDTRSVVSCVKHFALYGAPAGGRDYSTSDMSRRTMEETYFPPYRAAVDAGARTVMTSFNDIEGIPASGNRWLLTEKLRKEWKFSGWVVTDYTAVTEMKNHGTATSDRDAAHQALAAGVDMDMVSEAFVNELPGLLESGAIHERDLNRAVLRVLETKWDLGLFTDAFARCTPPTSAHPAELNRPLAREAARESIVLLKNDCELLPLARQGSIAVIGPLADNARDLLGCWIAAGDKADATTVYQAIRTAAGAGQQVVHAKGCGADCEDDTLLAQAVYVANHAEHVILVLGESSHMHGEAACRTDIRLPTSQRRLAKHILKTGKPCILVTLSGRPLELTFEAAHFQTILHAWAPGTEGGPALAEILFGDAAPVGKLTMGFPRNVGQLPMTYREKPTGRPFRADVQYSSKYLDCQNDALFPFGHGLTYGNFQMGSITLSHQEINLGETLTVSMEITNPGMHPVTDTLQLYLRDLVASVSRPVKELRGYQRITLCPGEKRVISFPITEADLSFPGPDFQPIVEPGEFHVMLGTCSTDLRLATFRRTTQAV